MFVMRNTAKDCVLLSAVSSVRAVSGYIAANTVPRRTENNCISGKEIFENTWNPWWRFYDRLSCIQFHF